jgi:signal transduction histidine kinase
VRVVVDARLKDLALDENAADHLYRIAREAVSNAVRHGNCRRVEVSLSAGEESLALRIEDDGRGRPEPTRAATGLGIRLMDYRARILGGTFAIGARAPTGTRVAVCVPLRSVLA